MSLHFYDADGHEVGPEGWADAWMEAIIKQSIEGFIHRAEQNVSEMTCPIHGGKAKLTFKVSGDLDQPVIGIEAVSCCDEFAQQAIQMAYASWAN